MCIIQAWSGMAIIADCVRLNNVCINDPLTASYAIKRPCNDYLQHVITIPVLLELRLRPILTYTRPTASSQWLCDGLCLGMGHFWRWLKNRWKRPWFCFSFSISNTLSSMDEIFCVFYGVNLLWG